MSGFQEHLAGVSVVTLLLGMVVSGHVSTDPAYRASLTDSSDPLVQACQQILSRRTPRIADPFRLELQNQQADRAFDFKGDQFATHTITSQQIAAETPTSLPRPRPRP